MEARLFKPLALVEPVRVRALLTRVEVKLNRALGASTLGEPCEKGGAVPAATSFRKRDEVVDVQIATPCEALAKTKTGYGYWIATIAQRHELVARELL